MAQQHFASAYETVTTWATPRIRSLRRRAATAGFQFRVLAQFPFTATDSTYPRPFAEVTHPLARHVPNGFTCAVTELAATVATALDAWVCHYSYFQHRTGRILPRTPQRTTQSNITGHPPR